VGQVEQRVALPLREFPSFAAGRVVLLVPQVILELAFQRALDHHLGQLAQQAAFAGKLQPAGAGPLGEFP